MKKRLQLGVDLWLPIDAVTSTFGILAVRGSGKSNTAAVMAEEMHAAGLPFCVVDPVGSWYGLRSSADGKHAGLPVPIFGGRHGDVPLERGAGELVADLVSEKRLTCVLDLSSFESEGAKKTFLTAFARRLYQRNEHPLHLFLEEADDYIPQRPQRDEFELLRAMENIVRRGRARGLGMTLITQRSAAVAKAVLTQVETLFAMRTTGPQDIAAIEAWVKYHQVDKEVLSSLASLENGEAWVWSPHYLKTMARHQIRRRRTFDSGATPSNVRAKDTRPPATLADIDLEGLKSRMAATIEKAKADDPRELRRQLAFVRQELQKAQHVAANGAPKPSIQVRQLLTDADRALLERLVKALAGRAEQARETISVADGRLERDVQKASAEYLNTVRKVGMDAALNVDETLKRAGLKAILDKLSAAATPPAAAPTSHQGHGTGQAVPPTRRASESVHEVKPDGAPLPPGEAAVLNAALQYEGLDRQRLSVLTGYKRSSRDAYIARLVAKQLLTVRGAELWPTERSRMVLGDQFEPLLSGAALVESWMQRLPEGERRIFAVLVKAHHEIAREELDEQTGYKRSSRDAYLTRLKARGLVEFSGRGQVRAAEELYR